MLFKKKLNIENLIYYRKKIFFFFNILSNESWGNDLYKYLKVLIKKIFKSWGKSNKKIKRYEMKINEELVVELILS